MGAPERAFLQSRSAVATLIQFYLGDAASPNAHPNPKIGKVKTNKLREKSNAPRFGWVVGAVAAIVSHCSNLSGATASTSSPALSAMAVDSKHAAAAAANGGRSDAKDSKCELSVDPGLRLSAVELELLLGNEKSRAFLNATIADLQHTKAPAAVTELCVALSVGNRPVSVLIIKQVCKALEHSIANPNVNSLTAVQLAVISGGFEFITRLIRISDALTITRASTVCNEIKGAISIPLSTYLFFFLCGLWCGPPHGVIRC